MLKSSLEADDQIGQQVAYLETCSNFKDLRKIIAENLKALPHKDSLLTFCTGHSSKQSSFLLLLSCRGPLHASCTSPSSAKMKALSCSEHALNAFTFNNWSEIPSKASMRSFWYSHAHNSVPACG